MTSLTFKLPEPLKQSLQQAADADGRSLSDFIRRHFEKKFAAAGKAAFDAAKLGKPRK